MKTLSIIIITIIISLVLSSSINNDNKYLKSSLLLEAADNLDKCDASKIASFAEFVKANFPNYSIYSKSEDSKTYSYIKSDRIMVVNLKTAGTNDEYSTIDIYTYTDTKKTSNNIRDIVGTPIIHYGFDATGKKLSEKTIFYEDGDNLQEQIYIQLRQVTTTTAGVTSYTVYSTCDNTAITDLSGLIVKAKEFLDLDHAVSYIATDKRGSTLTYADIKTKRLSVLYDKKYKTFYSDDNKFCSITYDGNNIYTIYYSESTTPISTDTNKLFSITETSTKKYIITCEGDSGSKTCNHLDPTAGSTFSYTITKSTDEGTPLYVFRDKVFYGTNKKTTEIKMEKTALEKVNKIWASCGVDIKEEPNSIGKYTYNIIILIILSFIYMI